MDKDQIKWLDVWFDRVRYNMGASQENLTPIRIFDMEVYKKIDELFGEMYKDLDNFGKKYSTVYSNKERYQNIDTGYKITLKDDKLSYESVLCQLDGLKDDFAQLGKVDDEGYKNAMDHLNQIVDLVNYCEKKYPETKKEGNLIFDGRIF